MVLTFEHLFAVHLVFSNCLLVIEVESTTEVRLLSRFVEIARLVTAFQVEVQVVVGLIHFWKVWLWSDVVLDSVYVLID